MDFLHSSMRWDKMAVPGSAASGSSQNETPRSRAGETPRSARGGSSGGGAIKPLEFVDSHKAIIGSAEPVGCDQGRAGVAREKEMD